MSKTKKIDTVAEYTPERQHMKLSPGMVVRMLRETKEMTQVELAEASGLTQTAISAIEREAVTVGLERARRLADAFDVSPALIAFPNDRRRSSAEVTRAMERERARETAHANQAGSRRSTARPRPR